jgi:hypothetical protein
MATRILIALLALIFVALTPLQDQEQAGEQPRSGDCD